MSSEEQKDALRKKLEARKNGQNVKTSSSIKEDVEKPLNTNGYGVDGYGNLKVAQVLDRPVMPRGMAWLAYAFSWLGIIAVAIGCDRKDDYVKRHLNNALSCHLLFTISCVFVSVFQGLMIVESQKYFYLYGSSSSMKIVILGLLSILFGFVALFSVIMLLMGWISSLRGQTRSLPIIGGFKFFK